MTLPMLAPFLNIAIVLNVIHVFNSFPIIWVMTQGGPNNRTHILVTYLYELSFYLGRPGPAAAVSSVMLAIVFWRRRSTCGCGSARHEAAAALGAVLGGAVAGGGGDAAALRGDDRHRAEADRGGAGVSADLAAEPGSPGRISRHVEDRRLRSGGVELGADRGVRDRAGAGGGDAGGLRHEPAAAAGKAAYRQFLLVTQMLSPVLLVLGLFRMAASIPFGRARWPTRGSAW
jgi:hypothetical protein